MLLENLLFELLCSFTLKLDCLIQQVLKQKGKMLVATLVDVQVCRVLGDLFMRKKCDSMALTFQRENDHWKKLGKELS